MWAVVAIVYYITMPFAAVVVFGSGIVGCRVYDERTTIRAQLPTISVVK